MSIYEYTDISNIERLLKPIKTIIIFSWLLVNNLFSWLLLVFSALITNSMP